MTSPRIPLQIHPRLSKRGVPFSDKVRVVQGSLLRSTIGGLPQNLHSDFDPASGRCDKDVCGSLIIALGGKVCLLLLSKDGRTIVEVHLQAGDAVWFHGFVVHAGSGYTTDDNLRAHFYIIGLRAKPVVPASNGLEYGRVADVPHRAVLGAES